MEEDRGEERIVGEKEEGRSGMGVDEGREGGILEGGKGWQGEAGVWFVLLGDRAEECCGLLGWGGGDRGRKELEGR